MTYELQYIKNYQQKSYRSDHLVLYLAKSTQALVGARPSGRGLEASPAFSPPRDTSRRFGAAGGQ